MENQTSQQSNNQNQQAQAQVTSPTTQVQKPARRKRVSKRGQAPVQ